MSHSREPKKLDTSYSETKHLLDRKLRQQRALMSTPYIYVEFIEIHLKKKSFITVGIK